MIALLVAFTRECRAYEQRIRTEHGSESQQWYDYVVFSRSVDSLVDAVPGAREAILRDMKS